MRGRGVEVSKTLFYAQQTGQFLLMQYRNHKFTTKAKSFLILSTATLDDNVCNVS